MKKLVYILAAMFAVSFASCDMLSNKDNNNGNDTVVEQQAEVADTATQEITDSVDATVDSAEQAPAQEAAPEAPAEEAPAADQPAK